MKSYCVSISLLLSLLAPLAQAREIDPVDLLGDFDGKTGTFTELTEGRNAYVSPLVGSPCLLFITNQTQLVQTDEGMKNQIVVGVLLNGTDRFGGNDFTFSPAGNRIGQSGKVTTLINNSSEFTNWGGCGEGFMGLGRSAASFEQKLTIIQPNEVRITHTWTCEPKNDEKGVVTRGPFVAKMACKF